MNDEELTAFAGKAFGSAPDGFSPLTDDGDALRLAVRLNFEVRICNGVAAVNDGHSDLEHVEVDVLNPCAAIRRAITHAAADIGKDMKWATP